MLTLDFLIRNLTVILDKKKVTDDYKICLIISLIIDN